MKPHVAARHAPLLNMAPLSEGLGAKTIGEIYTAIKNKPDAAVVRAGSVDQNWYLTTTKKENPLEAATIRAASIKKHRQLLLDLLEKISADYASGANLNKDQQAALIKLQALTEQKSRKEDFTAGELKPLLRSLSNSARTRANIRTNSQYQRDVMMGRRQCSPRSNSDWLKDFLVIDQSTRHMVKIALFGYAWQAVSLAQQRQILNSVFLLLEKYLDTSASPQSFKKLLMKSQQKDLLLTFADAWLDKVADKKRSGASKTLDHFKWKNAVTHLAVAIRQIGKTEGLAAQAVKSPVPPTSVMAKKHIAKESSLVLSSPPVAFSRQWNEAGESGVDDDAIQVQHIRKKLFEAGSTDDADEVADAGSSSERTEPIAKDVVSRVVDDKSWPLITTHD